MKNYDPVKQTKAFRQRLDAVLQDLKSDICTIMTDDSGNFRGEAQYDNRKSRERSLAITKLQESIMWLGMDLKAMNEEGMGNTENPYPESYNADNDTIHPTADGLNL